MKKDAYDAAEKAKTDFDGTASDYGYTVQTYSYGSDEKSESDGGFCDAVITAANSMKEGDVSDLIEGTDCYYIIRLDSEFDSDATEKKKQSIISDRQDEAYNNAVESYKKDIDINVNDKEWSKVAFDQSVYHTVCFRQQQCNSRVERGKIQSGQNSPLLFSA